MAIDWAGMAKQLAPGLGNLFSQGAGLLNSGDWTNPATQAQQTISGIPGAMQPYYQPYMDVGNKASPILQQQFGNLISDPGSFLNKIGQGYQKSPGFDFAMKEALDAQQRAESRGGMAGSPQHQQENMALATNLANKDFNDWLTKALGLYGQGLGGEQNLFNTGAQSSMSFGNTIGDMLAKMAELQYKGTQAENEKNAQNEQQEGSFWGTLGDLASKALPFFL